MVRVAVMSFVATQVLFAAAMIYLEEKGVFYENLHQEQIASAIVWGLLGAVIVAAAASWIYSRTNRRHTPSEGSQADD